MPFIPHTEDDVQEMLKTIGVESIQELFDEIPPQLLNQHALQNIQEGISEFEMAQIAKTRAAKDSSLTCFIGAGAYEHHIPAAVWEVTSRGEFLTAYTPYQAEASQGSLQLIYEYQSMMAALMDMQVSNASLYDGASALAEAVLMAARLKKKTTPKILLPLSVHPFYRETVKTIVKQQAIELVDVPYHSELGTIDQAWLNHYADEDAIALIIPQPNFFGSLEEVDQLTTFANANGLLTIAVVNPLAMALLKPPGQWGEKGADIACGEGQPLGIPLAGGGPYYGFLCAKLEHVRQVPGRLVGQTIDKDGKVGYVLTLQAREQHIRRAKATSNICTNQGLMVTASTIYMAMMGPERLRQVALMSHQRARELFSMLSEIQGVEPVFTSPFFHEFALRFTKPVPDVLNALAALQIQGGFALQNDYQALGNALLVCATETKTPADLSNYAKALAEILGSKKLACLG